MTMLNLFVFAVPCMLLQGYATDVCVPISKLPQVLLETKEELMSSPILGTCTLLLQNVLN